MDRLDGSGLGVDSDGVDEELDDGGGSAVTVPPEAAEPDIAPFRAQPVSRSATQSVPMATK
jgi:hypothetical protein